MPGLVPLTTVTVAVTVVFPLTTALSRGAVMHTITRYAPDSGLLDWHSVPSARTGFCSGSNTKPLTTMKVMSTLKEKALRRLKKLMNALKTTPTNDELGL